MNEDAGCMNPCGGEPMMCSNCPDLGSVSPAPIQLDPGGYVYDCFVCGFKGNTHHFGKDALKCPQCGETEEIG